MLRIASQSVSFEVFENALIQGTLPSIECLFLKQEYESWPLRKLAGLYTAKKAALCLLSLREPSYLDLCIPYYYEGHPKISLMRKDPNLLTLDVVIIESATHASSLAVGRFDH